MYRFAQQLRQPLLEHLEIASTVIGVCDLASSQPDRHYQMSLGTLIETANGFGSALAVSAPWVQALGSATVVSAHECRPMGARFATLGR